MTRTKKKATGALSERAALAPRLLSAGTQEDPLVVVRSDFWHFNGIGLFDGDEACVIDPGIRRQDVELLAARLRWAERDRGPRSIGHVVVTHSHHDHIRGWPHFEGAEVLQPQVGAYKGLEARRRILGAKTAVDARLGESHVGFSYPPAQRTFEDRLAMRIGEREVELRFLPGHSNCTSVVWIPSLRTLCSADYLVSPGLPYCRWSADAFDAALDRLSAWTTELGIERVWPSHNAPILGQTNVLAAIDLDRRVMQELRRRAPAAIEEHGDELVAAKTMASGLDDVRGWAAGKLARQDVDNARRVLAAVRG